MGVGDSTLEVDNNGNANAATLTLGTISTATGGTVDFDLNANGGATPVITSTSNLSAGTGGAYKWYVVTNGSGTFWATDSGAGTASLL